MRPARPVLVVLVAGAALLSGCGGGTPSTAATTGVTPTTGQAATTPSRPAATRAADGTWTSDVRLAGPVSDGRVVVGTARLPGEPTRAVALDAATGAALWDVPLGGAAPAPTAPTLLLTPDGPLVVSRQQETPGSGLTPASSGWQVARLDPASGRTLWEQPATGPAVAAGAGAVLVEVREGTQTAARGTRALDPADGHQLWTSDSLPVLLDGGTAVLAPQGNSLGTSLTGVDATTGRRRWDSDRWSSGTLSSNAQALAAARGHLLVAESSTDLSGSGTSALRVRDLTTGEPVGDRLPAPRIPAALVDTSNAVAVVHEKQEQGADTGVYAVDMTTGTVLWKLDAAASTTAYAAGGGVAWLKGADGVAAVDDRTGTVREQSLAQPPALVLDHAQLVDDGPGLRSAPLPR